MRIEVQIPWRPKGTDLLFHTGVYRVPQDISEAMASKAIEELAAIEIAPPPPKPKAEKPAAKRGGRGGNKPADGKPAELQTEKPGGDGASGD